MPQISLEEILEKSISRGIPDHRNIRNNHQVKPFAPVIRKSNKHGKLEITIKSSFDGSNQITKTSFNLSGFNSPKLCFVIYYLNGRKQLCT